MGPCPLYLPHSLAEDRVGRRGREEDGFFRGYLSEILFSVLPLIAQWKGRAMSFYGCTLAGPR